MNFLQNALDAPEPALTHRFFVRIPNMQYPMECIVDSIDIVFHSVQAKGRQTQGSQKFYQDMKDIATVTIVFHEAKDFRVTKYLYKWREQVVDKDGNFGAPVTFKRDIYVDMLSLETNEPVLTFLLKDAWPTDKSPFNLNYMDDNVPLQVSSTFSVDGNDPQFINDK